MISLEPLRRRLAVAEATPLLAVLGVCAGFSTGIVMLMFRAVVDLPLKALLPGHDSENFEGLPPEVRLSLAVFGALLLGLWMQRQRPRRQSVGVVHVMERLSAHQGALPLGNAIVQFIGGAAALLTGQSGGREGPAIHLGAAASSLIGQFLELPNNSVRTLVACGTAAAIAGSFNTPLAGVVFAMEVVMMEYTIASFVPVMLAAVTSTLLNQAVFGDHTAFQVPDGMQVHSLIEYPFILLEGLLIGCVASAFLAAMQSLARLPIDSTWARVTIAGIATGGVCIVVPEVMGIGYDTVERTLQGGIGLGALAGIAAAKLLVSGITYALRVPVGIIGPTLVIGACTGAAFAAAARPFTPDLTFDTAIYVMLGMGAMMGAVLQAPLAALIAIVELTGTPNITLPAMLAIVVATITTNSVFRLRSVFLAALDARGLSYTANPVVQHLQRTGVRGAMDRSLVQLSAEAALDTAIEALRGRPHWVVVEGQRGPLFIFAAGDLMKYVDEPNRQQDNQGAVKKLSELPIKRLRVASVGARATMQEAWDVLLDPTIEAVCVRRVITPRRAVTLGVLTRDDVLSYARLHV